MISDTVSTTISAPVKAPTIEALAKKAQRDGVSLPVCAGSALDEWADTQQLNQLEEPAKEEVSS